MTIHSSDPFATPEGDRSQVRRVRGRLVAPVTLWTAPGPAGLTVSSVLIADGSPGRVLGLVDGESELWEAASSAGRFAVTPLAAQDRQLSDRFAGLLPAPGGLFAGDGWVERGYGPVPAGASTWIGCSVLEARECGWGLLVEATIEELVVGEGGDPLIFSGVGTASFAEVTASGL